MTLSIGKPFNVDTSPTKIAMVNSLTRDITVEACVFDLIDNSIDAARREVFSSADVESRFKLPESYAGFKIFLNFDGERFSIRDNCSGISVEDIKKTTLRFGERSENTLGIGIFGLGLNRALFKLGGLAIIHTDTGLQRTELVLDTEKYLRTDGWEIPANEVISTGKISTEIEVTQLKDDIAISFSDKSWVDSYRDEISRRYGRFIRKGLIIKVNGIDAFDGEVHTRGEDSPFEEQCKSYLKNNVYVTFKVGQHRDHRFSAEPDYNKAKNSQLTQQYGWTVLCNDRAVIMSDRSLKTGWDAKFHTEFYGFVGVVNFVSESPSELPWNTTKTDVDLNNSVYHIALNDMRKFAQQWRQFAGKAKGYKRNDIPLLPSRKDDVSVPLPNESSGEESKIDVTRKSSPEDNNKEGFMPAEGLSGIEKKKIISKTNLNKVTGVLPFDVSEIYCADKHLSLVQEAKRIILKDFHYIGLALIRILFEVSAAKYFQRKGLGRDFKDFVKKERENKNIIISDSGVLAASSDECIAYLKSNKSIWGDMQEVHLNQVLNKLSEHKKLLNGVVHNPFQIINVDEAFAIRDAILPILRFLIEND